MSTKCWADILWVSMYGPLSTLRSLNGRLHFLFTSRIAGSFNTLTVYAATPHTG